MVLSEGVFPSGRTEVQTKAQPRLLADGLLQSQLSTALGLLRVELKLVALAKTFHVLFSHEHLVTLHQKALWNSGCLHCGLSENGLVQAHVLHHCPCWSTKLRYHVETRGTATGPKGPQVKTTLNPHSTKCGLFSLRCSQLLELRSS